MPSALDRVHEWTSTAQQQPLTTKTQREKERFAPPLPAYLVLVTQRTTNSYHPLLQQQAALLGVYVLYILFYTG